MKVSKVLDGDIEGVEKFLKDNSNYGPLFCAWERIKKERASTQEAAQSALKFLRDQVPSAMDSYPNALGLISQMEERLKNIVEEK